MIKAVIFDIDNTLYNYDHAHAAGMEALCGYAKEQLGWTKERFLQEYREIMSEIHARAGEVSTIHNRIIRFTCMLEKNGLPLHPHALCMYNAYWENMIGSMERIPGTDLVLQELKRRGIRIGIGTDMTALIQMRKLEYLGLLAYIDFVVTSEEACIDKPGAELFRLCVQKAGSSAGECLFVGDSLEKDYLGAIGAGLQALWFVPDWKSETAQKTIAEKKTEKLRIIRDLNEVLDQVKMNYEE